MSAHLEAPDAPEPPLQCSRAVRGTEEVSMGRIEAAFERIRGYQYVRVPWLDAAERYVALGERAELARVSPGGTSSYAFGALADAIAPPPAWTDQDRRALHVLGKAVLTNLLGGWLEKAVGDEKEGEDRYRLVLPELATLGMDDGEIAKLTARSVRWLARNGRPTSAGRFLLARSDDMLKAAVVAAADELGAATQLPQLLRFFLDHAADRVRAILPAFLETRGWKLPPVCAFLLEHGGEQYEKDVLAVFRSERDPHIRFQIGVALDRLAPDRHGRAALEAARASLSGASEKNNHPRVAAWMLARFPEETLDDVVANVSSKSNPFFQRQVVSAAVSSLRDKAARVVLAALEHGDAETRLAAIEHLLDLGLHPEVVRSAIVAGLGDEAPGALVRFVALAARMDVKAFALRLWPLLAHKSKPVRDAAARTLGKLGDAAVPTACEHLGGRKAAARLAAVGVLGVAGTPAALAALEGRLGVEEDEDVRDAIYRALSEAWRVAGRAFTHADLQARITRSERRLAELPAKWLDLKRLRAPRDADGRELSEREVRYLLFRQSRAKEMAPDVEAAPLLARVRGRGGDFAVELFSQFLASGADAGDRWAMSLAALVGDDRLVPPLVRQVREWADASRGKLAEYGAQALALLGTDEALVAVDALALRYRTKNKNVGRAAVEAFAAAAEAQGLTPEELGDRVVPWLGFPREGVRVIEAGAKRIEATIGLDLKLAFKDASTGKRVASLPKAAPEAVRAEMKDLAASLREVARAQVLRLENLMVRQRRWPVDAWKSAFLAHPLLVPFAVRLVWASYDGQGRRGTTFRALSDRSLTDAEDGSVALPAEGTVGIVHPLELSEEKRQAWRVHLADHEVDPPFPQLERPVVHVDDASRPSRAHESLRGTSLNAMTFKGRAERLGWHRGSVCDGGGITSYWKGFPAAGADAFLELEGMYMGIDMSASIQLGTLRFVRGGSVAVGSYTYDDPTKDEDPRVLSFGDVPPIVFSEVMGDLNRIAGVGHESEAE